MNVPVIRTLGVTVGAVAVACVVSLYAFNPQPDPPGHWFGMVGLGDQQTARLYVSNIADGTTVRRGVPPSPCHVALAFVDAFGTVVAASEEIVHGGHSAFLDFAVPPEPVRDGRAAVRAQVQPLSRTGHCVSSVEVFNEATGESSLFLNPLVAKGFNPQPEPPAMR